MCYAMARAQRLYGPHDQSIQLYDGIAFGRSLFHLLPEDRYDRQPLISVDERYFLVADLRIDNRPELCTELGLPEQSAARSSDADILLFALQRWGSEVVDHLVGDYAFAAWDAHERQIFLARDPFGQRPLHYHRSDDFFAFSSMPAGLIALGAGGGQPDEQRVAEHLAGVRVRDGRSFFNGIKTVLPGQILTVTAARIHARTYWKPARSAPRLSSMAEYVDAFRARLDQAVQSRLRGCDGAVAAHLSSGYDSSAVAATAARLLGSDGGKVVAFTSAPRAGFAGGISGSLSDESGVAAVTASLHPNLEHVVLRPDGATATALLRQTLSLAQHPAGHVCNNVWWATINQAVSARGLKVLLTCQMGNMTVSAGGLLQLPGMVGTGRWRSWLREARALARHGDLTWRGILARSFGPWMPQSLWDLLSRLHPGLSPAVGKPRFLHARWIETLRREIEVMSRTARPARSDYQARLDLLQRHDPGNHRKMALARWGIDERDPTADRRLAEFCLSLPADMLLRDGRVRPLARAALADRLPPEVLEPKLRGYQMADWYEQITQKDVQAVFDEVRHSRRGVIDFDRLRTSIEAWPTEGWENHSVIAEYRVDVLSAIAAALFLARLDSKASG